MAENNTEQNPNRAEGIEGRAEETAKAMLATMEVDFLRRLRENGIELTNDKTGYIQALLKQWFSFGWLKGYEYGMDKVMASVRKRGL